ncbi:restriction endonuclease [Cognatilysobacter lacus]|uniref:Restriction endonuclease n=1 Tax=Cognatilysobacter lacus TaxID=1643323 RepID=A0A5D8YW07_9GAMM|nr:restriction endonuclease [Lysobacter lacus]TZF86868.1 restriction endonuclease [Lysobacter lacus]
MVRRKESALDVLAALPWQIGIALGVAGYWFVRHGAAKVFHASGGPIAEGMTRGFETDALAPLAWMVLAVCWIGAAASYIRRLQRARLLATRSDLASIAALDWRQFEQLVGEAFRRQGYAVEETGQGGADGGVDLILRRAGSRTLVQCKQWRQRQVNVSTVREMWGLLAHHGADAIKIVCVGGYTDDARRFAHGKAIDLITGSDLVTMIAAAQNRVATSTTFGAASDNPSAASTDIGATAAKPTCPRCSTDMALRTNRQNGEQFWGCSRYPQCRGTRALQG